MEKVFEALTDPLNIRQWSGDEAIMSCSAGSDFSLWGGSIHGRNVEITPTSIVQEWKEKDWDFYSEVKFKLIGQKGETKLEMTHSGIPENSFSSIDKGWDKYYLGPIKVLLET